MTLDEAIATGVVPPRPEGSDAGWAAWFDTHARCTHQYPGGGRCYVQRDLPGALCLFHRAAPEAAAPKCCPTCGRAT